MHRATDSLFEATGHTAFISDRDVIVSIAGTGVSRRDYVDRPIAPVLERAMDSRRSAVYNKPDDDSRCRECGQKMTTATAGVILSAGGDPIGAVVLASTDPNVRMGTLELKLAETAAGFLARQMEQ